MFAINALNSNKMDNSAMSNIVPSCVSFSPIHKIIVCNEVFYNFVNIMLWTVVAVWNIYSALSLRQKTAPEQWWWKMDFPQQLQTHSTTNSTQMQFIHLYPLCFLLPTYTLGAVFFYCVDYKIIKKNTHFNKVLFTECWKVALTRKWWIVPDNVVSM